MILLDQRAGSPPTATSLLVRHAKGHSLDSLEQLLREWELWAAELLESHTSYPMLTYYRSQYTNLSWVTALGAIMDTCSLVMVGLDGVRTFQARMSFSIARLAIVELSRVLAIPEHGRAEPRLSAKDFARMRHALETAGLALVEPDAELRLARFRTTYEPFLHGLAQYLMVPLPVWIGRDEELDNWEKDPRGTVAKTLVEALTPEPKA